MAEPLSRDRVEALAAQVLLALRPTLAAYPRSNENVLVALNAVAAALSPVIAGTRFDPGVIEFFRRALAQQLHELDEQMAAADELAGQMSATDPGTRPALPTWLDL